MKISTKAKCVECNRIFDLLNEEEAGEWAYGHDCEVQLENGHKGQFGLAFLSGLLCHLLANGGWRGILLTSGRE